MNDLKDKTRLTMREAAAYLGTAIHGYMPTTGCLGWADTRLEDVGTLIRRI